MSTWHRGGVCALLLATLACGAPPPSPLPPLQPTPPDTYSGDVIVLAKTGSAGRLLVFRPYGTDASMDVTADTTFGGAVPSFDEMAAAYRAGQRLTGWAAARFQSSGYVAESVSVSVNGATPHHETISPISPTCEGPCPEPGSADWTGGVGILTVSNKWIGFIYSWTVFRPDGDYHSMAEMLNARQSGIQMCVAMDGWVVGIFAYHATSIGAYRLTASGGCPAR